MSHTRGADLVARALARAGVAEVFSLSGNQIMPLYDAALDAKLNITHVRHEGAAVHMADAWGRLTGAPGVALLTGGPGHANGIGALYTALASESPMVLLSGHAPLAQLGRGAFQEMAQSDMASPVTKASWTAQSAASLGRDIARALSLARAGRPGPVHLSLPFDLLEARLDDVAAHVPDDGAFAPPARAPDPAAISVALAEIGRAARPLVIAGPSTANARDVLSQTQHALGVPVVCMESPRGINDPCLGAFGDVLPEADLIVLVGKQPDYTLRFGQAPGIAASCRFIVIDPEEPALQRALNVLGAARVAHSAQADALPTLRSLAATGQKAAARAAWTRAVQDAVSYRPEDWGSRRAAAQGPLHPVEVGRAVQRVIERSPDTVLVVDGGEFGQWAQACVTAPTRIINGPGGSIGSGIPFAMAARRARPRAPVVALLGDGTFGFHMAEFDTAVRANLPFVAVVGNDARWNAEYQIQLRSYGADRTIGCELLPARYDQAVAALGAHGECVTRAGELPAALDRALASGRPACVNVMIDGLPAPVVSRAQPAGGATH